MFLWGWGGFILGDRWESDYQELSAQTGVPVEQIDHALAIWTTMLFVMRISYTLRPFPLKLIRHYFNGPVWNNKNQLNLIGAQRRSGFVATLLTLTAFGHAKARRDSLRESLNLHLLT